MVVRVLRLEHARAHRHGLGQDVQRVSTETFLEEQYIHSKKIGFSQIPSKRFCRCGKKQ